MAPAEQKVPASQAYPLVVKPLDEQALPAGQGSHEDLAELLEKVPC
jgi:hypothetical protein